MTAGMAQPSMIFSTPKLETEDREVLDLIRRQRDHLRHHMNNNPQRWMGFLRQNTFARAIQGSNSIEGYHATVDDAVAAVEAEEPMDADQETWLAITGYRNAMTYILQLFDDPFFEYHPQLIRSLHFMMISYHLSKHPGQWRPGYISVIRSDSGEKVYEGPDVDLVPRLMNEFIASLNAKGDSPVLVQAALAHLNLTMIHPFSDGNGRMARAIQTLVLAREGILSPIFSSIEEYLGRNTQEYYAVLAEVGQGQWNPGRSALPWVRFCLKAHYQQAATLIKRNAEVRRLWEQVGELVQEYKLPERCEAALVNAAYGLRVRNVRYRAEADVTELTASRDLKKLADLGILMPSGEGRGRFYIAGKALKDIRFGSRDSRRAEDPYELIKARGEAQPMIPGLDGGPRKPA